MTDLALNNAIARVQEAKLIKTIVKEVLRKTMESSLSPSTSSSSDVFLAFRGVDTRNTFTAHLNEALTGAEINTFVAEPDQLRGKNISEELLGVIEGAKMTIVVFSKKYATSRWCLDELVQIMKCRRTLGQVVLPIFYHVDPSDVRNQKGCFAKAFENNENSYPEKVHLWRNALKQAADLSGFVVDR